VPKKLFGLAGYTNRLNPPIGSASHWANERVWDRWQEESRPRVGVVYQQQREKVARYLADLSAPVTVLELCCGTGRLAYTLLSEENVTRYCAVDINPQAIARLQEKLKTHPRTDILQAEIANVLEPDTWRYARPFDIIICLDALHNLPWASLSTIFERAADSLAPGGRFVGNYLSSENIDAHTINKHGRWGYWRIYGRLLLGKILTYVHPALAGKKGMLRTGTIYRPELTALLEQFFTVEQLETGIYHWFVAAKKL
jgi:SAM-dependent methyltransferase